MHELSLCRSIAAIADRNRGERRVTRVGIRLGAFRQAIPQTLTYCWGIVTQGTALEGSALDFEIVPLEIECRACSARSVLPEMWLRCPGCGATDIAIVHGEEFMVTTMDLAEEGDVAGAPAVGAGTKPPRGRRTDDGALPPAR